MQINAILFGIGAVTVLTVPTLSAHAKYLIPAVIIASFLIAPLLSGFVAKRMRLRNWGRDHWKRGDFISG